MISLGMSFNASDAISGSGSLDVMRYGRVLRSRQLVGVRGVGLAYDGMYYVNSVTHNIKRGEYKQNFSLIQRWLDFNDAEGTYHERDYQPTEILRQIPRHGHQQR